MTTPAISKHRHVSRKASLFTESVIREMTREALKHGAVNLSQGFPDFPAPEDIKGAAVQAIGDDLNQYAITWGARDFREAIARKSKWYLGLDIDPETELTVTCGSTEGMIAAMMATVDPGEEVVVFEPFYENYAPDAILSDARPRYVPLRSPDWNFEREELRGDRVWIILADVISELRCLHVLLQCHSLLRSEKEYRAKEERTILENRTSYSASKIVASEFWNVGLKHSSGI